LEMYSKFLEASWRHQIACQVFEWASKWETIVTIYTRNWALFFLNWNLCPLLGEWLLPLCYCYWLVLLNAFLLFSCSILSIFVNAWVH